MSNMTLVGIATQPKFGVDGKWMGASIIEDGVPERVGLNVCVPYPPSF